MSEINLLDLYPKSRRPLVARGRVKLAGSGRLPLEKSGFQTTADLLVQQNLVRIARQFGREYFDGDRLYGYGGYFYNPKFWTKTARRLHEYYKLGHGARVLDVGCAKGFLLHDLKRQFPDLQVTGVDISSYACENAHPEVRSQLMVGDATSLPFPDNSFDLVVSINTVSNPPLAQCKQAIREIMRVAKNDAFITVHAWRTEEQKMNLTNWNLTAMTALHVDEWKAVLAEIWYTKDYYWSFVD